MAKRTDHEIAAEVAALKEIRDKPTFRNDNDAAITAQIDTLEHRYSENEVYEIYEDPDEDGQHVLNNALEAIDWMDGEEEDGSPSEGWEGLY